MAVFGPRTLSYLSYSKYKSYTSPGATRRCQGTNCLARWARPTGETRIPSHHDTFLTGWVMRRERTQVTARCDKNRAQDSLNSAVMILILSCRDVASQTKIPTPAKEAGIGPLKVSLETQGPGATRPCHGDMWATSHSCNNLDSTFDLEEPRDPRCARRI